MTSSVVLLHPQRSLVKPARVSRTLGLGWGGNGCAAFGKRADETDSMVDSSGGHTKPNEPNADSGEKQNGVPNACAHPGVVSTAKPSAFV